MNTLILLSLTDIACPGSQQALEFSASGQLEDATIREASGLARSQTQTALLWIINDNGAEEILHAIDPAGKRLGEFKLVESKNVDWEDLASFRLNDKPYLMVADIGDNEAKHKQRSLYFVEEPPPAKKNKALLSWRLDFRYPDGPRDAESAAVDVQNREALILSKRDIPPLLYAVPLRSETDEILIATKLGAVTSLTAPTSQDLEFAPVRNDWFWQPVGMDISQDNRAAVILTYRALFYFERQAKQTWLEALNTKPYRIGLGDFKNAEAVAFGDNSRTVVVTGENKNSIILSVNLQGVNER